MDRFSATAVATIAATAISFVASRYWTFKHRERSGARRETVLFFAVNGVGVGISEGCVGLAFVLGFKDVSSYNIALIVGIALATLFRFWSYKRWVWPAATAASGQVARPPVRRSAHGGLSRVPGRELAKFGIVGTFAFLVTGSGSFLLHVCVGAGPLTSSAAAIATAMAISYVGNRCWTFRHRQHMAIRRGSIRYITLQGAGLVVQLSCVAFTAFVLRQHGAPSYDAALVVGTGLGAAIRFWSCREWVWLARRPVPAPARPVPG